MNYGDLQPNNRLKPTVGLVTGLAAQQGPRRARPLYSAAMSTRALDEALRLPVSARIQLVQEIWDSVVAESGAVRVTKKQKAELDRRLTDLEAHPEAEKPWSAVLKSLKRRR